MRQGRIWWRCDRVRADHAPAQTGHSHFEKVRRAGKGPARRFVLPEKDHAQRG